MKFHIQRCKIGYLFTIIGTQGRRNWPIIRFCLLFCLYSGVILFLLKTAVVRTIILNLLSMREARLTNWFLNQLGIMTQTMNSIVLHRDGFAIDITYKCTGIRQLGFFIAGVLAYRSPFANKLKGMIIGTFIILAVNHARLVNLFVIGVYASSWFNFIHDVLWELLMILTTFLTWLFWLKKVGKAENGG